MICLLLILCWILISSTVFATEENTRVAYFRTRENKRLPGYVVRSFASSSLMSCSHSCLRNSWCTSTNFKEVFKQGDKGTCELNKHEIVSINEDTQLVEQHGVTFSVFLKDCRLNGCFNGGSCLFDEKKETFSCSCKPLWSGDKCEATCQGALGMESGAISDGQVRASSAFHGTDRGRLNFKHFGNVPGGWTAKENDRNQWLEVDLQRSNVTVTGVATQGRSDVDEWVTRYKIQYRNNGVKFHGFSEEGQSMEKEFEGNMDRNTAKRHDLNPPLRARYVRFCPTAWNGRISMRVELYGCHACNKALGMENRAISDRQITASSEWRSKLSASQGRLHNTGDGNNAWGAWIAGTTNQKQWLQVDLIQTAMVTASATQGRGNGGSSNSWVTKYKLQYSDNGTTFKTYTDNGQSKDKEFAGNTDRDTVVYNDINPPIIARYVRFRPTAWQEHITMRVELYGCNVSSCQSLRSQYPRPPSGVYWINPDVGSPANRFKAYCDMETDGGGWTLVWSYRFTNYENFTEKSNAITPRPDWSTTQQLDVLISTTPPLNETDYNAIKFSLWKQLGRQVLIKSNINNWLICNPGTGSLVDWQDGSVSCRIINRVTDRCNKTEAPCRIITTNTPFGPWLSGREISKQIYYYFDGYTKGHWPVHDPCGEIQPNHLQDVNNPHGNIFVR